MTNTNSPQTAVSIWLVADLLRGNPKQSQYGCMILPFTLLCCSECVLVETKDAVVAKCDELKISPLPEDAKEKFLLRISTLSFFNTSKIDLGRMDQDNIKANLESYV